ncbi:hypothetical protein B0A52_09022 [Exophiala mesophila]|uniref:Uncharacterized protein n=1 Tax=Exophiala mesophila TaxID=212818 RepID=A0A438MTB1_EXOME|nr:hypothetical protein B0A52_09022 [Exophiala mesophila]
MITCFSQEAGYGISYQVDGVVSVGNEHFSGPFDEYMGLEVTNQMSGLLRRSHHRQIKIESLSGPTRKYLVDFEDKNVVTINRVDEESQSHVRLGTVTMTKQGLDISYQDTSMKSPNLSFTDIHESQKLDVTTAKDVSGKRFYWQPVTGPTTGSQQCSSGQVACPSTAIKDTLSSIRLVEADSSDICAQYTQTKPNPSISKAARRHGERLEVKEKALAADGCLDVSFVGLLGLVESYNRIIGASANGKSSDWENVIGALLCMVM